VTAAVQTAAEMADFRAGTKRETPIPNQQHFPGIAILREASGGLALFINGQGVNVRLGQVQLALSACLLDSLGRRGRPVPFGYRGCAMSLMDDGVNITARLEGIAKPDAICLAVSEPRPADDKNKQTGWGSQTRLI
jgi:hypothetical protein